MFPITLQLYTIREDTAADFFGTLGRVAEIGYDGVEFAGYYDTPAAELKRRLDDLNLRVAGTHLVVDVLRSALDEHIEYAATIGCPAIICPGFWGVDYNEATFRAMSALFNQCAERCAASGVQFGYHVHGHEFVDLGGKTGMDLMFEETSDLVKYELDTHWVERAGVDSLAFFNAHRPRITHLHLKDAIDRENWRDTEVGAGVIDMRGLIAAAADHSQVEWLVVEQEAFDMPRMDSIAISLRNIRAMMP